MRRARKVADSGEQVSKRKYLSAFFGNKIPSCAYPGQFLAEFVPDRTWPKGGFKTQILSGSEFDARWRVLRISHYRPASVPFFHCIVEGEEPKWIDFVNMSRLEYKATFFDFIRTLFIFHHGSYTSLLRKADKVDQSLRLTLESFTDDLEPIRSEYQAHMERQRQSRWRSKRNERPEANNEVMAVIEVEGKKFALLQ